MPKRPPIHQPAGARRAEAQRRAIYQRTDARRAHQSLYDHRWRDYSKRYLQAHPYCVRCYARGVIRASTVTDHKTPHRGDPELFKDPSNHQALCTPCHNSKTATEDRGFAAPGARKL